MVMKKKEPAYLTKAVKAFQLYLGSVNTTTVKTQQKLYDRARKQAILVAEKNNIMESCAYEQLMDAARSRGPIMPSPGKDF